MSLAVYLIGVIAVVMVMLSSCFLGEQSHGRTKNLPYEAGIKSFGSTRLKFFSHYFLLAILFVVFDMESVFVYLWSSSIRELGWLGFFQMGFFLAMLLLGLLYAYRLGVFNLVDKPLKREELS